MSNGHYTQYGTQMPPQGQHVNQQQQQYNNMPSQPGPAYAPPMGAPPNGGYGMPGHGNEHSPDGSRIGDYSKIQKTPEEQKKLKQRKLIIYALCAVGIVLTVLFTKYKSDFERWVKPLEDWLRDRESWSWVIPVVLLVILSFPPLFGGEIIQLIVGLTYPLGVAIGIACAGSILGEAACFIVFKLAFTPWVQKKISTKVKWAAIDRVTHDVGFKGVLVIRYSIIPPHLANPLFACTGMPFWIYMTTVVLSLPKGIVFVALGTPDAENSKVGKWCKIIAIVALVLITVVATRWIRKKMIVAEKQIAAERGEGPNQAVNDEELGGLVNGPNKRHNSPSNATDTSYHGAYR